MKVTSGSLKDAISALPIGKYAGYYNDNAADTPNSFGTFEAVVLNSTAATITAVSTSTGKTYSCYRTSSVWSGWETHVYDTDLMRKGAVLDSYLDSAYCDSSKDNLMYAVIYASTVQLNFVMGPKGLTGDDIVATLPAAYRPVFAVTIPISARNGSGEWRLSTFYPAYLRIAETGTISLITGANSPNVKYINGLATYFK